MRKTRQGNGNGMDFELDCAYAERSEKVKKLAGVLKHGAKSNMSRMIVKQKSAFGNLGKSGEQVRYLYPSFNIKHIANLIDLLQKILTKTY